MQRFLEVNKLLDMQDSHGRFLMMSVPYEVKAGVGEARTVVDGQTLDTLETPPMGPTGKLPQKKMGCVAFDATNDQLRFASCRHRLFVNPSTVPFFFLSRWRSDGPWRRG